MELHFVRKNVKLLLKNLSENPAVTSESVK